MKFLIIQLTKIYQMKSKKLIDAQNNSERAVVFIEACNLIFFTPEVRCKSISYKNVFSHQNINNHLKELHSKINIYVYIMEFSQ